MSSRHRTHTDLLWPASRGLFRRQRPVRAALLAALLGIAGAALTVWWALESNVVR